PPADFVSGVLLDIELRVPARGNRDAGGDAGARRGTGYTDVEAGEELTVRHPGQRGAERRSAKAGLQGLEIRDAGQGAQEILGVVRRLERLVDGDAKRVVLRRGEHQGRLGRELRIE